MNRIISFFKKNPFWIMFLLGVLIYLITLFTSFNFTFLWIYVFTCFFTLTHLTIRYVKCPKCKLKIKEGLNKCKCGYELEEKDKVYKRGINISTIIIYVSLIIIYLLLLYILMRVDVSTNYNELPNGFFNECIDIILERILHIIFPSIVLSLVFKLALKKEK